MREALLLAIERARTQPPSETPAAGDQPSRSVAVDGMPEMEMTWDQYRAWTKYAAAIGRRDYRASEDMFPALRELFGESLASVLVDAYVEDYRAFLASVTTAGCEGFDPDSVWRKTVYMSFALVRLNRSSAELDQHANQARLRCGFPG